MGDELHIGLKLRTFAACPDGTDPIFGKNQRAGPKLYHECHEWGECHKKFVSFGLFVAFVFRTPSLAQAIYSQNSALTEVQ
jgi:hypothetical protein